MVSPAHSVLRSNRVGLQAAKPAQANVGLMRIRAPVAGIITNLGDLSTDSQYIYLLNPAFERLARLVNPRVGVILSQ